MNVNGPPVLLGDSGIAFFGGILISILITPMSIRLALAVGAIDYPDSNRKHHGRAVPRLGGISITVGFMVPPLFILPFGHVLAGVMAGAVIIAMTGFIDDLIQLRPIVKLVAQLLAAACFVFISGQSIAGVGNLFGFGQLHLGYLAPWFTIFGIVGVTNAFNLSDGLDGLAAGFAIIASLFLSILAYTHHDWLCQVLLLSLMGGSLGFLRYNTQPARLFMGDTGSMTLGYSLATMAILMTNWNAPQAYSIAPVTVAIVLGLPILDTLIVMSRRMLSGKMPLSPDRTHLHHRLLALGLPHDQTVMLLYVCMTLFGCLALIAQLLPDWQQLAFGLIVGIILFTSLSVFERAQMNLYDLNQAKLMQTITSYSARHSGWLQRNTRSCALITMAFIGIAAMLAPSSSVVSLGALWVALILALLLYPWHPDREQAAIQKGIIYLMLAALFFFIQTSAVVWLQYYLVVLAVVSLGMVLARATSWNVDTHGSSSFQVLVLLGMAIIPLAILPLNNSASVEHVVGASFEAVPVAWLLNGYSVHIYKRNRRVFLVLMALIVFILLKSDIQHAGILSTLSL